MAITAQQQAVRDSTAKYVASLGVNNVASKLPTYTPPKSTNPSLPPVGGIGYSNGKPIQSNISNATDVQLPTSVISSKPAVVQVNKAKDAVTTANNNLQARTDGAFSAANIVQPGYNKTTGLVDQPTPPPRKNPTPPTTDDHLTADALGTPYQYNQSNGNYEMAPVGTPTHGPVAPGSNVTGTVDVPNSSIQYQQNGDGTYSRYDSASDTYTKATAEQFTGAQTDKTNNDLAQSIINGSYQLNPSENAQIQGLVTAAAQQTAKQQIVNANITGTIGALQALGGTANSIVGQQIISNTVTQGLQRIKDIQDKLAGDVASMTKSLEDDDYARLKTQYDEFTQGQQDITAEINDNQARVAAAAKDADTKLQNYMYQQMSAHPDAKILPGMTAQQIQDAVSNSLSFTSKQSIVDTTPVDGNAPPIDTTLANTPSSITSLSPNTLWQYANDYALSGKSIQSYVGGLSSAAQATAAKDAIRNKSGAILSAAGVDMPLLQTQYKALSSAAKQQMSFLSYVDRALSGAENASAKTQTLFDSKGIDPFSSTWANKTINDITKQLGDSGDIRAYQAAMYEVGNEYAQVFARGGARSQEGNTLAQSLVNGNVKLEDIQKTLDTLQTIGGTVIKSSIDQVQKLNEGGDASEVVKYLNYIHSAQPSTYDGTNSTYSPSNTVSNNSDLTSGWTGFPGQ